MTDFQKKLQTADIFIGSHRCQGIMEAYAYMGFSSEDTVNARDVRQRFRDALYHGRRFHHFYVGFEPQPQAMQKAVTRYQRTHRGQSLLSGNVTHGIAQLWR